MGDTFNRVMAIEKEAKLKEICNMICEHEFILSREYAYSRSKYIYLVKLEEAGSMASHEGGPV